MINKPLLLSIPFCLSLAACSSDSNYDFDESKDTLDAQIIASNAPEALFSPDPAAPVLPNPNSLFFLGSQDGTLNIPLDPAQDTPANPIVALNQMDGFSTVAPISTTVSEPLLQSSLELGNTVRVFEVQTQAGIAVTGINREINNPLEIAVQAVGNQLVLLPTVPLKPKTDYMVMITNGITDVDGEALEPSLVYTLLKGSTALADPDLESLRGATLSQLAAAQGFAGVDPNTVALSWVFKTQSITDVLQAVKAQSDGSTLLLAAANATTSLVPGGQGKADIYIGSLEVPYYLSPPGEGGDPTPALTGFWLNQNGSFLGAINATGMPDYTPVATGTQTIPVIMTVPNATSASGGAMPTGGWPVTVFQHGITRDRLDTLSIADAMADIGRVVIGIDMPLHGITDESNPLHASSSPFGVQERTFDLDIAANDNTTASNEPDGVIDPSGQYFYNLQSLPTSRDNLRQAIADLWVLGASIGSAQVEGLMLNSNNLSFYGQSLGAIVGTSMLAFDNRYQAASLAVPGGGISQLLANSESFGPEINSGLEAAGLEVGSADYNAFLLAAQTLVDSGDPINHASTLAQDTTTGLHMIEVIGDAVIPNAVATAPIVWHRALGTITTINSYVNQHYRERAGSFFRR